MEINVINEAISTLQKISMWKMGDVYEEGPDRFILARTLSPNSKYPHTVFIFQFICLRTGNRFSDTILERTRLQCPDSISITLEDVMKILEKDDEDTVLISHRHILGPEWE